MDSAVRRRLEDQARMLAIGHVVVGLMVSGIGLLFSIYIPIGIAALAGWIPLSGNVESPYSETFFGLAFLLSGLFVVTLSGAMAVASFIAARCFRTLRHRTFLVIVQFLHLLHQPFGTVLGVFGLVYLMQAEVQQLFAEVASERRAVA